jgi:HrpA-like RNA helicase
MRRLRPTLGMKVGLRMGDDIKDESSETVIHFVTCGYILKLMAHHPGFFSEHTHIIVDEVHERSIEGDMLCMMTRKLLTDYPGIRLVLMSATMETDLLKDYYADIMYPRELVSTFVGVRCFPLKYYYLEDILKDAKAKRLPNVYQEKIRSLIESTKMCRGHQEVRINRILFDTTNKESSSQLLV